MKNIKKNVAFILTLMLILSAFTIVNAAGLSQKISAILDGEIAIKFNGKVQTFKDTNGNTVLPISYNGTTYLPVRAVSNLVGLNVDFDSKTNTVLLNDKSNNETTVTNEYSRKNPAPINTSQTINIETFFNKYTAEITVNEITDGNEAWKKIKDANMFNNEPKKDHKYILAKIKVKISNVADDKAVDLTSVLFTAFSNENVEYADETVVVTPKPILEGKVYDGGTLEGYVAFEVKNDDANPKFVFGKKSDGTGGIWFKLTK